MELNEGLVSAYGGFGYEFMSFNVTVTQAGKLFVVVASSTPSADVLNAVKADLPACSIELDSVSTAEATKTMSFMLSR